MKGKCSHLFISEVGVNQVPGVATHIVMGMSKEEDVGDKRCNNQGYCAFPDKTSASKMGKL